MNMFSPEWLITHPISAIAILLFEYITIMLLYYRFKQHAIAKVLAVPFVIQDALVNWFVLSVFFIEEPHEVLVTSRLKRWKRLTDKDDRLFGMRRRFAWFMCDILNKFDPEGHC